MPVCSRAMRSLGCSTIRTVPRSRAASAQMGQGSASVRLKQSEQWRMFFLTSSTAR
jgi:hypothetical protein